MERHSGNALDLGRRDEHSSFATVVKVELEDEITYNLGHGEVVTFNE